MDKLRAKKQMAEQRGATATDTDTAQEEQPPPPADAPAAAAGQPQPEPEPDPEPALAEPPVPQPEPELEPEPEPEAPAMSEKERKKAAKEEEKAAKAAAKEAAKVEKEAAKAAAKEKKAQAEPQAAAEAGVEDAAPQAAVGAGEEDTVAAARAPVDYGELLRVALEENGMNPFNFSKETKQRLADARAAGNVTDDRDRDLIAEMQAAAMEQMRVHLARAGASGEEAYSSVWAAPYADTEVIARNGVSRADTRTVETVPRGLRVPVFERAPHARKSGEYALRILAPGKKGGIMGLVNENDDSIPRFQPADPPERLQATREQNARARPEWKCKKTCGLMQIGNVATVLEEKEEKVVKNPKDTDAKEETIVWIKSSLPPRSPEGGWLIKRDDANEYFEPAPVPERLEVRLEQVPRKDAKKGAQHVAAALLKPGDVVTLDGRVMSNEGSAMRRTVGLPGGKDGWVREAKMYSLQCGKTEKKTAKGVQRAYVRNHIQHADYRRCLFSQKRSDKQQLAAFNTIRSKAHKIQTLEISKVGLCAYDNKRYLLDDGISSYAYGHHKIAELK
eukprot:COSAG02_NODE_3089_length_7389_cov_85.781481_1_plen_562_part_00